jgi:ribosomal protein S18 acetylase RimI-like enzyme
MFVAFDGAQVVGSIYGLRDRENADVARIGGTWVAPSHRRRGVGRQLLQGVVAWACDHRFVRLALWAPSANAAALALYRQAGFKKTGRRQPLRNNSTQEAVELERHMPTQGSG